MPALDAVITEIEAHVALDGWDRGPVLFALVRTQLLACDPQGALLLGLAPGAPIAFDALTPVAQDALPDEPLDVALAGIEWPDSIEGCAVTQEIVILPPGAEEKLSEHGAVAEAAAHPDRREARLVVATLRDGRTASVLRIRGRADVDNESDELAYGNDLAPNLAAALRETLS
jgi:hypothetical protein